MLSRVPGVYVLRPASFPATLGTESMQVSPERACCRAHGSYNEVIGIGASQPWGQDASFARLGSQIVIPDPLIKRSH